MSIIITVIINILVVAMEGLVRVGVVGVVVRRLTGSRSHD